MDRKVSHTTKQKRKRRLIIKGSLWALVAICLIIGFRMMIKPTIERSAFQCASVEIGTVEASVPASGTVLPEYEEVFNSPIQSRILSVALSLGSKVHPGDTILSLDTKETESNLRKLIDELKLKKNNISKLELQLEKELIDLRTSEEIKKLYVDHKEALLKEEEYLLKIGGGTKENVKQARLDLDIARIELKQIQQKLNNRQKSMNTDLLGLNYEISIQQNKVNELQYKIEKSTLRADKSGVITFIDDHAGKNVSDGQMLVKIADLQSFEVQAHISDQHANKLKIGGAVLIRINENTDIRGSIKSISPSVDLNSIQFIVGLNTQDAALLRPNLKVDVFVLTSLRKNVLRIPNGAFYNGGHKQQVFVLKDDKLIKRSLGFGESNADWVEVVSGLKEGEEIVTSKLRKYGQKEEISVKNQ